MRDEKKGRWRELCEQIAVEQDFNKLHALIAELSRALEEREREKRLRAMDPNSTESHRA
jgi:hypothetical protein